MASQQQFENDQYLNSHDDREIEFCFQQHHEMGVEPRKKM
jgi:hypothetical protein